jgi:hypothetical protein
MNTLELAYALEANADLDSAEGCNPDVCKLEWNAAVELRRLHEVNAELLFQMRYIQEQTNVGHIHDVVSAAIAKAEGEKA